jgi:hypothetical protein
MAYQPASLNDEEFFYAHVDDYLDESIPASQAARYDAAAKKLGSELPQKYRKARGNLQIALQSLQLGEGQMHQLVGLLADDATRAKAEDKNITEVEKVVMFGNLTRSIVIFGTMILMVLGAAYYLMGPRKKENVDIMKAIRWETDSMEQSEELRLDFPTDNLDDAQNYIKKHPELGFEYTPIKPFEGGWDVIGTSVIDYDVLKMPVIAFKKEGVGGTMFLFFVKGDLAQLPAAEPGNQKGLLYQAYGTEAINMIAWQYKDKNEKVLAIMVSRLGAAEMAQFARQATLL